MNTHSRPNLSTPSAKHPYLAAFVEKIKPGGAPVVVPLRRKLQPCGNCYWNVFVVAEELGGAAVHGWMLLQWRDRFLQAVHHAVWRSNNGDLIDVSEKAITDPVKSHTLFLPDDSITASLESAAIVPNRYEVLDTSPEVVEFIDTDHAKNDQAREIGQFAFDAGYRCEAQYQLAKGEEVTAGMDPHQLTAAQIATWNRLCEAQSSAVDRYEAACRALWQLNARAVKP